VEGLGAVARVAGAKAAVVREVAARAGARVAAREVAAKVGVARAAAWVVVRVAAARVEVRVEVGKVEGLEAVARAVFWVEVARVAAVTEEEAAAAAALVADSWERVAAAARAPVRVSEVAEHWEVAGWAAGMEVVGAREAESAGPRGAAPEAALEVEALAAARAAAWAVAMEEV